MLRTAYICVIILFIGDANKGSDIVVHFFLRYQVTHKVLIIILKNLMGFFYTDTGAFIISKLLSVIKKGIDHQCYWPVVVYLELTLFVLFRLAHLNLQNRGRINILSDLVVAVPRLIYFPLFLVMSLLIASLHIKIQ
jgi:hypothetical protein